MVGMLPLAFRLDWLPHGFSMNGAAQRWIGACVDASSGGLCMHECSLHEAVQAFWVRAFTVSA